MDNSGQPAYGYPHGPTESMGMKPAKGKAISIEGVAAKANAAHARTVAKPKQSPPSARRYVAGRKR